MSDRSEIRRQAELHAAEHKRVDPAIEKILWFPDDSEVRLVETEENLPLALSGEVEPFYFNAAPGSDLPAPHASAIIRTDEIGKLKLPEDWGTWEDAVELEVQTDEVQ